MKPKRRWLKSAIAASAEPQIALPWARGRRRRPLAVKPEVRKFTVMTPAEARKAAALRSLAAR